MSAEIHDAPSITWQETHRNLTDDEIRALPFDLKICFYLAPWNISATSKITSVDAWADVMALGFCDGETESSGTGADRARRKAWSLIAFLKTYAKLGWVQ